MKFWPSVHPQCLAWTRAHRGSQPGTLITVAWLCGSLMWKIWSGSVLPSPWLIGLCRWCITAFIRRLPGTWWTTAFQSLVWTLDVMSCIITSCLDTVLSHMAVGHLRLLAQLPGTHLSDDLRDPTLSTDSFRRLLKIWLFSEY